MAKPRVRIPKKAKAGEVFQVKTLISHKMESGQRKDKKTGKIIPRKIINKFTCSFNGKEIFSADIAPAVSANPFIAFSTKAVASGEYEFSWHEDGGAVFTKKSKVTVA